MQLFLQITIFERQTTEELPPSHHYFFITPLQLQFLTEYHHPTQTP